MSDARSPHAERSTLVRASHATFDALRRAGESSRLAAAGRTLTNASDASRSTTLLDRTADALDRWLRGSALYRWLTAEPDPEVIVIDLRETYAVGPLLSMADRLRDPAERTVDASRILRTLDSASALLADSRTARLLAVAFAPPPPPEKHTPDDRTTSGRTPDSHTADERTDDHTTDDRP